jgi:hypothetical protein
MNSRIRGISPRRIVALVVAIACHAGILVVMLRPTASVFLTQHEPLVTEARTLELRLIPAVPAALENPTGKRAAANQTVSSTPSSLATPLREAAHEASRKAVPPAEQARSTELVSRTQPQPQPTPFPAANPPGTAHTPNPANTTPQPFPGTNPTIADGGFQQRLDDAQRAGTTHGVPGSDMRRAPAIQLINPMDQGVGAVMRSTQRLFGIPDRHCIDVEVWRSLSQDERNARHVSPSEIKAMDEKYSCNKPMGLVI